MKEIILCGRPGCVGCVKAKTLESGGLELKDAKDGREIVLTEDERNELRTLFINGVL
jgi:hypothetical protein